ncbi:MAG: agmatine deiminase family protein [SAR324 cluster bacterium]|nr:agmatine deiminase family protein [SAR324 cluster bacterium]
MSTVSSLGYHMPAEWHPHTRCFMGWPCRVKTWGEGMAAAKAAYVEVAKAIGQFEPVVMTARPEDAKEARSMCGKTIEVLEIPMDDSWTRDSGPTFVIGHKGNVAGIDWEFNQWGADFPDIEEDADFAKRLLDRYGIHCFSAPFVLEGGSIHTDGDGTLLTTEQCLLHPNRNPDLRQEEIEQLLKEFLGVHHVIWLGDGLLDDISDGHVSNIACFAKPGIVLALTTKDPQDENYEPLRDNLERLRSEQDARGHNLEVIPIEQPEPEWKDDTRLAMSYINFYLPNGGIVMPAFDDPERDEAARETLQRVFPERKVVQIPAMDIVSGGGGIHCITQQQPQPDARS